MILLFDPAHEPVTVALVDGGVVIAQRTIENRREQSAKLLEAVDHLLAGVGLRPDGLAAIAVVRGPGSFTSLRVGLACANALAQAAGRPMIGLTAEAGNLAAQASMAETALADHRTDEFLLPEYGRPPSITPSRT
jgi:tRNA threonylcarbamoyladenosine biosynthesis protein TsaB